MPGARRLRVVVRHAALRRAQRAEAREPARSRAAAGVSLARALRRGGRAHPARRRRRAARHPRRGGQARSRSSRILVPATPSSTTPGPMPIARPSPPTPGRARWRSCGGSSRPECRPLICAGHGEAVSPRGAGPGPTPICRPSLRRSSENASRHARRAPAGRARRADGDGTGCAGRRSAATGSRRASSKVRYFRTAIYSSSSPNLRFSSAASARS